MVLVPDHGTQLELRCRQGGISPSAPPRPKPQFQSVPPILRRRGQNSMPGYSKGAQGLSVYVRVTGIFTGTTDSPSALRRQCPNRYAIRAGRNFVLRPRFPVAQTIRSPDRSELRARPSRGQGQRFMEPCGPIQGSQILSRYGDLQSKVLPSVLPAAFLQTPGGFHRFELDAWTGLLQPLAICVTRHGISVA